MLVNTITASLRLIVFAAGVALVTAAAAILGR